MLAATPGGRRPDWLRLNELEVARGRARGWPRVKFTRVEEMLAARGR